MVDSDVQVPFEDHISHPETAVINITQILSISNIDGRLIHYVQLEDGKKTLMPTSLTNILAPQLVIQFYEKQLYLVNIYNDKMRPIKSKIRRHARKSTNQRSLNITSSSSSISSKTSSNLTSNPSTNISSQTSSNTVTPDKLFQSFSTPFSVQPSQPAQPVVKPTPPPQPQPPVEKPMQSLLAPKPMQPPPVHRQHPTTPLSTTSQAPSSKGLQKPKSSLALLNQMQAKIFAKSSNLKSNSKPKPLCKQLQNQKQTANY